MSGWKTALGGTQHTSQREGMTVLPGVLSLQIHPHLLSAVPCWTALSAGFSTLGHPELQLTVQRRPDEGPDDWPRELLSLFQSLFALVQRGERLLPGGWSALRDPLFPGSALSGVLYTHAQPIEGVADGSGQPRVCAVLVRGEELQQARAQGVVRILSRLGQAYRYFPVPPWADRDRKETVASGAPGILANVPTLMGVRLVISQIQQSQAGAPTIELWLTRGSEAQLQEALSTFPVEGALAILAQPHRTADACLVWTEQSTGPTAISAQTESMQMIAGNFFLLVPQQQASHCQIVEDGFAALLTDADAAAVREALCQGRDLHILSDESDEPATTGLRIRWLEPGASTPAAPPPDGPLRLLHIELGLPESELSQRITADALAGFVGLLIERLRRGASSYPVQRVRQVRLEVVLDAQLAVMVDELGEPDPVLVERLLQAIADVPLPAVAGSVRFALMVQLSPV